MATREKLEQALMNAHNAGDTESARLFAAELKKMKSGATQTKQETYDPTEGMAEWQKVAAGAGKAIVDTGRGLGSLVGLTSQQEIDDAKRRDAPLMKSGAGIAGNIGGNLMTMVGPAAALGAAGKAAHIPQMVNAARAFMMPKTVLGAGAAGGAMGAIQPVASDESRLTNIGVGTIGGAAVPALIAGGGVAKNLVAPFTQGGREKLAGRVLERFAQDADSIGRAGGELVPGSVPTLAEATQDIGLAQLQRSLRNNPDTNNAITSRMLSNQDARLNALRDISGDPAKREFYEASRKTAADELYGRAMKEVPVDTAWVKGQITQLLKRPTFREAWQDAAGIALDDGLKLDRNNVVQVAHYTKLALDRKIESLAGKPEAQRAAISVKDKLVSLMESKDFAPSYREARDTFAKMSQPINQMDLGQSLIEKLQPALSEFGASARMTPQKYAEAVRNIDQTAKTATGFRGARADRILSPDQMGTVENVARDLGRSANAQELGMARGSPTAQNLVGQDILRQTLGPFGLPKGFADTAIADTLLRPVSFAYKAPEQRLMGLLGDAVIDPKEAKRLLEIARKKGMLRGDKLIPYTGAPGTAGLLTLSE
jgi:hypothetical protein